MNKRENLLKIIFIRLVYFFIILIVLYDTFFIIYTLLNPNKTPSLFGFKTFSIISGSMAPEINIGDLIIVRKDENMKYSVGDIVSFRNNEDVITHRIVEIKKEKNNTYYITKGDNNEVNDEKIEDSKIEGKLICKIPYMGNIALLLKNKIAFGIILFSLIFSYIYKKKRITKKIKRKEKREKFDRQMRIASKDL